MALKKKPQEKVPVGALKLFDGAGSLAFKFSDPGDDGSASVVTGFEMVGYSGGVIADHWYWGNLVINLSGIKFAKGKFPILRDHATDMEIGFSSKPQVSDERGLVFTEKEVTFLDNEESQKFIENSKAGFPYQASIRAQPTRIVRLAENEERKVNGFVLKGPGTVWMESEFKECSICVFGYDSNTSAKAFAEETEEVTLFMSDEEAAGGETETTTGGATMPLTKFMKDHPDAYATLVAKAEESANAKFSEEVASAKAEADKYRQENKDMTIKLAAQTADQTAFAARVEVLEASVKKSATLSHAAQAKMVFTEALAASSIPADLHGKVEAMVSFSKFVKDGEFAITEFSAAVAAEVADWSSKLPKASSVQGFASSATDVTSFGEDGEDTLSTDDQATIDAMARHLNKSTTV